MMFKEEAIKKLNIENKNGKFEAKANVMKKAVLEALKEFARQDEEFAQAIVQGGSFEGCMQAVENGVGNAISDLDAYKKAVQFYFPGAAVRFAMQIDVCPNRVETEAGDTAGIVIDLEDFL